MEMSWAASMLFKILLCYFIVSVDMQVAKGCLEKERLGLLEIKEQFKSRIPLLPSWVDDREANCCGWESVKCSQTTGRVTQLSLDDLFGSYNAYYLSTMNMSMNLSLLHPFQQLLFLDLSDNDNLIRWVELEGLCGLKYLQELDLSNTPIVRLPECMANLTNLRVLDLSSTNITGNVPSFITSLKSLEYLSLFDTKFHGLFLFSLLANHSKLEFLLLSTNASNLHVETKSPPWIPTFQLKALQLENCNLNAIPRFLLQQHQLRLLDLSHNKIKGEFPSWLLDNNSHLETLRLKDNSLTGTLQLPITIHGLLNLDISSNKIGGQLPKDIGKIFPNLSLINLAKNFFEGLPPSSMIEMQRVQRLDLSNNKFIGELPRHFFSNWTSLLLLSLSHNNFSGQLFPKFANSTTLKFLFLNNNHFYGEISDEDLNKSSLEIIDISNNNVFGRVSRWIGNFSNLGLLSLSNNFVEAEIPKEICTMSSLHYLDLSENNLYGTLPDCLYKFGSSPPFLHLQKNALTGPIPNENIYSSFSLDLRDNKFYGQVRIPTYSFFEFINSTLEVFLIGGNQLNGSIPNEICQIQSLKMLDFSRNRFTGTIPSCLANISSSTNILKYCSGNYYHGCISDTLYNWINFENAIPSYNSTLRLNYNSPDDYYMINELLQAEFRTKQTIYTYSGKILGMMTGFDLSSNELNGSIPPELGYMGHINTLNLSRNHFSGAIPQSFSNLIQVESLDLSYNNLSGAIPPNLVELHFLAIFNVSYNNLSGQTPITGQFANFDEDNYRGNPGLFGFVNGSSYKTLSPPPPPLKTKSSEGGGNHTAIELVSFYWGFFSSYVAVVLGLTIILWFSPYWCKVWFRFVDLCIYYCFPCFFRDGFC